MAAEADKKLREKTESEQKTEISRNLRARTEKEKLLTKPIRILLVDDHTLVRAGIRSLLKSIEGIEVIAEASDGREALRAGAAGYMVKGADAAELEIAIRAVAHGETYLSPTVSKHVVTDYIQRISGETTSLELLTPRQREVLQLIAEGYSTKKIAHTLKISVKTVETHRMQLMERLDIHDIAGLVRYAIRVGLVEARPIARQQRSSRGAGESGLFPVHLRFFLIVFFD